MTRSVHRLIPAASVTALALLFAGCKPANTFQPPPPPKVTVANPTQESVTTYMEFPGRLEAAVRADIRARVTGFLRTVEFEPGQVVGDDQLLFTIEPEPFEADLAVAKAAHEQAVAAKNLAEEFYRRVDNAAKRDAVAEFELLEAKAKLDEAEAAVLAAEANVLNAQIQLGYTKVYAPFAGRLSENLVDVGNLVSGAEATLLTTIVADDPIHAYFNVDERRLLEFLRTRPKPEERGQQKKEAFLRLLDGSDYAHQGFIDFANNELDQGSGSIRIRAEFPNAEERLYPGLFVRVRIPSETADRILVPEIALQRDQIGPFLLAVDAQGVVVRKDVTLGDSADSKRRIITEGITPADRIIVNGLQRARPGATVNPAEAGAPNPQGGSGGQPSGSAGGGA